MPITYQSQCFAEANIVKSYIAFDAYGKELKRYDVNAQNRDIRVSVVNPVDYDKQLVEKAYSMHNQAFKQIAIN